MRGDGHAVWSLQTDFIAPHITFVFRIHLVGSPRASSSPWNTSVAKAPQNPTPPTRIQHSMIA